MALTVGSDFESRYEILEILGSGGMATVYRARHKELDRSVAVKIMRQERLYSDTTVLRFQQEGRSLSRLEHPNLLKLHSFGISEDGYPYLVTEFVQGKSLAQLLKEEGALDGKRAARLFEQVCLGLQCAHEAGIVHRDIKPSNIMISEAEDGVEKVKIVDFGIAKTILDEKKRQRLTQTGDLIGSPAYMSPEQCQGNKLEPRSDLYSLAVVMYETLVGEPPFTDDNLLMLMSNHASKPVTAVPVKKDKLAGLQRLIVRCLDKEPSKRIASAAELGDEIRKCLDGEGEEELDCPVVTEPHSKKNRKYLPAIVLVVCLMVGVGVFISRRENLRQQEAETSVKKLAAGSDRYEERKAAFLRLYKNGLEAYASGNPYYKSPEEYLDFAEPRLQIRPTNEVTAFQLAKDHLHVARTYADSQIASLQEREHERQSVNILLALESADKEEQKILADVEQYLSYIYLKWKNYKMAEPRVKAAVRLSPVIYGPNNTTTLASMFSAIRLSEDTGRYEEAASVAKDCVNRIALNVTNTTIINGHDDYNYARACEFAATNTYRLGKTKEAAEYAGRAQALVGQAMRLKARTYAKEVHAQAIMCLAQMYQEIDNPKQAAHYFDIVAGFYGDELAGAKRKALLSAAQSYQDCHRADLAKKRSAQARLLLEASINK